MTNKEMIVLKDIGEPVSYYRCGRKIRYVRKLASAVVRKARRGGHPTLGYYRCRHCGYFHVGHKPGTRRILAQVAER